MDLGNIVYIVAVLAYFIYQATKNRKNKQKQNEQDSVDAPEPTERSSSFDDLLKEIRGAQKQSPSPELPEPIAKPLVPAQNLAPITEKPKSVGGYNKPLSSYIPRESTYQKPVSSFEKRVSTYGKPINTYKKPVSIYDQRMSWKKAVKPDGSELANYDDVYEEKVYARASDITSIPEIPTLEIEKSNVKSANISPYAKLLRNPSSVRDVIVLTEILTRRHF
jgi:hypothetical protein